MINRNAENARQMEWTLTDVVTVIGRTSWFDCTSDITVEKETLGNNVRSVEAADTERYNVVEGNRGSKIDQADKTCDTGGNDDGVC